MAEQIILNTDLYDNLLTERKGDYTAKPRITGTLYNTDIAARIVAARTEYQHGTILNILDMADSHKVQAIAEGKSVVNGVAAVGPVINTVTDSTSKAINGQLSSGGALVLGGVNLKIQGDDPSIGVYLTPTTEGAAPMKAPVVIANSPSQVIVQMPTLADGQYTVSLTTQYSGSRNVKEPRTYTFPIILIVGEGGGGATARVRTRSEDNVVRHVRTTAAKHRGQRLPSLPDRGYRTCRKKQPIYKPYYTHRT